MRRTLLLLVVLVFCCDFVARPLSGVGSYRMAWYNVENLFDTIHQVGYDDHDYTPEGFRRWTGYKLYRKCEQLYRVLTALGEGDMPILVGLCEVENDTAMHRLLYRTPLWRSGYKYLITRGDDRRGINVAMLYQPAHIKVLSHCCHSVPRYRHRRPTRQWIEAKCLLYSGDTVHVLLAHLPSRMGGVVESEPYRMRVAQMIRARYDSLLSADPSANVVLMGDFNDTPNDRSITQGLRALPSDRGAPECAALYNLAHPYAALWGEGSNKYRAYWTTIDQCMVSGALLRRNVRVSVVSDTMCIYKHGLLVDDPTHGGVRPKRTFYGAKWENGYSDHLPIYIDLRIDLGREY